MDLDRRWLRGSLPHALPLIAAMLAATGSAPPALAQDSPAETSADRPSPPPEGVTPQVELAIQRALGFLVRSQESDGSLTGRDGAYPVAMTALGGLALLGGGSTATRGPQAPAVRRATAFLLQNQMSPGSREDGLFTNGDEQRPMYGQAFAMTFLAQVLGGEESLERQAELREALRRAVDLTVRAQTREGGWYYYPNSSTAEGTLTVTMMQGLRACRDAGIHVPKSSIDRGVRYIERSANADGSVRYQLESSQVRYGVTCAAAVALWCAGRYEDPLLKRISAYIEQRIRPQWGTYGNHATYVQYYLGQANFYLGGDRWRRFYAQESTLLLQDQQADGSWLTQEERMHGVGAVYSTAVALIILELPYDRLTIFQR